MVCERRKITIPVRPWFSDHHFDGRIVLAAVDAMQLLAVTVQKVYPHLEVSQMHNGRFARLLEIPTTATVIDAVVELEDGEPSEIRARLMTRTQGKVMTRLVTHCELTFVPEAVPCAETEEWATGL